MQEIIELAKGFIRFLRYGCIECLLADREYAGDK